MSFDEVFDLTAGVNFCFYSKKKTPCLVRRYAKETNRKKQINLEFRHSEKERFRTKIANLSPNVAAGDVPTQACFGVVWCGLVVVV